MTRIGDPDLRIADVRWWLADRAKGRRDYAAGHIPGAVFVDLDADLAAPPGPGRHPLPSPAAFAARMAELGFDDTTEIVAYDDAGGTIAARLWWMLDDLGHHRVRVLDGGIGAWTAIGGALTADVPSPARGRLTLADRWSRTIDGDELRGTAGRRRPHRRPRTRALPRRDRARRCGRRPHPDGRQPAQWRQPRSRRSLPVARGPARTFRGPVQYGRRRDLLRQRRDPRATTRWRCGLPASRTRSFTPARTATGRAPAGPWRPATSPACPRSLRPRVRRAAGRGRSRLAPGRRPAQRQSRSRGRPGARPGSQQAHLGPDRQPELVPDEVERPERRDDRQDGSGATGGPAAAGDEPDGEHAEPDRAQAERGDEGPGGHRHTASVPGVRR